MSFVVKSVFGTDIRRFQLPIGSSYTRLLAAIADVYQIDRDTLVIKYRDDEGDIVSIASDVELHEAVAIAGATGAGKTIMLRCIVERGCARPFVLPDALTSSWVVVPTPEAPAHVDGLRGDGHLVHDVAAEGATGTPVQGVSAVGEQVCSEEVDLSESMRMESSRTYQDLLKGAADLREIIRSTSEEQHGRSLSQSPTAVDTSILQDECRMRHELTKLDCAQHSEGIVQTLRQLKEGLRESGEHDREEYAAQMLATEGDVMKLMSEIAAQREELSGRLRSLVHGQPRQ